MSLDIRLAYDDLDAVRALFGEYVAMLGIDLCFQNYDAELAGLPGKYAPPDGRLYLAVVDGAPAGCIALRRYDQTCGELKRLFVRPEYRGRKIGQALIEKAIAEAGAIGYESVILDTLTTLKNSMALYAKLGFREIEPYYANPHAEARYYRLDLKHDA